MTIKLQFQRDTFADRMLGWLGKQRAYIVPISAEMNFGAHVYAITRKESFWACLCRGRTADLPPGYISKRRMEELQQAAE